MCKKKVFISHSGLDIAYVIPFTELLESIGLPEECIFCSSVTGYGVPLDQDIYDYLANEFKEKQLHVIYCLSENYYNSAACLNEMGAAWVLKNEYTTILMPGFSFKQIDGAVNPRKIGINLGGDIRELKQRLNELKDNLIQSFNLQSMSAAKWERYRDDFISAISLVTLTKK